MKDWELILRPLGGPLLAWSLAAGAVLAIFFMRRITRLNDRRRLTIYALRAASLLIILALLLRPEVLFTSSQKQTPTVLLLLDRSRSMLTPDAAGGRTRWQELQKTMTAAQSALKALEGEFQLKVYTFAEDLRLQDWAGNALDAVAPTGRLTALGSAMQEALSAEAGRPVAAAFLLSDGAPRVLPPRDLFPPVAARLYADVDCPILPVRFGEARAVEQSRDISLSDLNAPGAVFVKNELDIAASARLSGFANQELPVQLLFEQPDGAMKVVDTQILSAGPSSERSPISLKHLPDTSGEFKVTVKAAEQPGELVTSNNELSTFITVKPGGLNVLYLEASIRPEARFFRTSIDASPDIRLQYERLDSRKRSEWPVAHPEWFTPGAFDVYILGDLPAEALSDVDMIALKERINQGAGLGMLGGWYSFGAGGYSETPLAGVLPVETSRLERQPFGEPPTADLHLPGPVTMLPSKSTGGMHYLMKLASSATNAEAWAELPPLLGANKFSGVKKAAIVLAESDQGATLLAVAEFGGGRTLAFAGDSTYQWVLKGKADLHRRFWRQIILWLARQDQKTANSVWVELDSRRHRPLSRVEFRCGAVGADGAPLIDGEFTAEIVLPNNQTLPLPLTRQDDKFTGAFVETTLSGDYRIRVRCKRVAEDLGSAEARFLVFDQDYELDNPSADPGMLSSLASLTKDAGGKMIAPEEFTKAIEDLKNAPTKYEVEIRGKVTLWSHSALFWPFAAILALEWQLRKKWGLV